MSKKGIVSIVVLATLVLVVLKVLVMRSANKEIKVVKSGTTIYAVSSGDTSMSTEHLAIPSDILDLKNKIYKTNLTSDERSQAMNDLSRKNTDLTLKILGEFIASPYEPSQAIEIRLRVQAIAGIASYPNKDEAIFTLEKIEDKRRAGVLGDQMRRAVIKLRFNSEPQK